MAQEAQLIETDSLSHRRNAARIAKDEAELQELLKEAGVVMDDATDEEEETVEAEPSNEEPVVEPEVQADSVAEQEPEAQEADDAELSAEEKNFKKRYGDLRRHMQEKDAEFKKELDKLKAQLDAATKNELVLPKSKEDIEAWAKKYPDVAGIVEAIAEQKATEKASSLDERIKEIEEMRSQARREKAEAELAGFHPDFGEIRKDDAFHKWAEAQPKWVQDALYENMDDAKSVARVIDLYKVDAGITTKKKPTADKGAASSVKSRNTSKPEADQASKYLSESQVAKMSMREYEANAERILEAQRSGKFIYDLSKK